MGEEIRQFYIYALLQDNKIVYIGQTDQAPIDRLWAHMAQANLHSRQGKKHNRLEKHLVDMKEYPQVEILYKFRGLPWMIKILERLYISSHSKYLKLKNTQHTKYHTSICQLTQAKIFINRFTDRDTYYRFCQKRAAIQRSFRYKSRVYDEVVSDE